MADDTLQDTHDALSEHEAAQAQPELSTAVEQEPQGAVDGPGAAADGAAINGGAVDGAPVQAATVDNAVTTEHGAVEIAPAEAAAQSEGGAAADQAMGADGCVTAEPFAPEAADAAAPQQPADAGLEPDGHSVVPTEPAASEPANVDPAAAQPDIAALPDASEPAADAASEPVADAPAPEQVAGAEAGPVAPQPVDGDGAGGAPEQPYNAVGMAQLGAAGGPLEHPAPATTPAPIDPTTGEQLGEQDHKLVTGGADYQPLRVRGDEHKEDNAAATALEHPAPAPTPVPVDQTSGQLLGDEDHKLVTGGLEKGQKAEDAPAIALPTPEDDTDTEAGSESLLDGIRGILAEALAPIKSRLKHVEHELHHLRER